MIVIGLTGQTGAGKTTLCDFLRARGMAVIDADVLARDVANNSKSYLGALVLEFGMEILDHHGELNRKKLADVVFHDRQKLRRLNAITHPHIAARIEEELMRLRDSGVAECILDAPTLFEAGCERMCSFVVAVVAPEEMRLTRIMERDGLSREDAAARSRSQHDEEFFRSRCRFVLENTGSTDLLVRQMDDILEGLHPREGAR